MRVVVGWSEIVVGSVCALLSHPDSRRECLRPSRSSERLFSFFLGSFLLERSHIIALGGDELVLVLYWCRARRRFLLAWLWDF